MGSFSPVGLIVLGLLLLVAAGAWWYARRLRAASGLPPYAHVVSSDTGDWRRTDKPLFSRAHLLTGKPDYVVQVNGVLLPVEVKPNRSAARPTEYDILQLAAYGLLLEETTGTAPPYGLLKYRAVTFRVDFTPELRTQLLSVLGELRRGLDAPDLPRSHEEPARCQTCGYRAACGQVLEYAQRP